MRSGIVALWIIAIGVIIALLYLARAIFAPFALAVFLFLVMEGFTRLIRERIGFMSENASRAVSISGTLLGFGIFIGLLAQGIAQFSDQAGEYEEKIKVGKLNVDDNPDTATKYGIRGIPTLLFFKGGEVVQQMVGVKSKTEIKKVIDENLA